MKEGHAAEEPSLLRGIALLRSSGSAGVKTARGCPRRWYWSLVKGGTETRMPRSWDEVGWLPSWRERRSAVVRRGPEPATVRHEGEEQGTADLLPVALNRRSHRGLLGGGRGSA
ncbi:hypothetical protein DPX16_10130 [Anabarilius grahami]|uniref:Uncharacterized protein n=1 Tax=Anabarilius grahami TaxID=495550 RepID=A0A3N0XYX1_ANAGA|nr:hypothetical protein DPX16_10130 [Anabarilius grahami]